MKVLPDLTIPGHPEVFVVGDMMAVDGVPGVAQGAIQGGRYAADAIKAELKGQTPDQRKPFSYYDKGSMATISRYSAVMQVPIPGIKKTFETEATSPGSAGWRCTSCTWSGSATGCRCSPAGRGTTSPGTGDRG